MPSSDIGGLPPLFKGALQGIDLLVIVDVSGSETKRISVADLMEAGFEFVPEGSIPWDKIENVVVETDDIADGAVTEIKLADSAVTTIKLADGAVTFPKLDPDIVIDCGTF